MKRTIEIEHRARYGKATHARLLRFLRRHARSLGKDDKHVYFYELPKVLYKVVKDVSHGTAKLVLKKSRIHKTNSFDEVEIAISPNDIGKANEFISAIPGVVPCHDFICRENFMWKGVEIALKYSPRWGYHAELEVVVPGLSRRVAAEKKIRSAAATLGITLMTTNDIGKFLREAERGRRL